MVKRWYNWCIATHKHDMAPHDQGPYVRHADYLSLQEAFATVVDQWEWWEQHEERENMQKALDRIAELRKRFLDV